MKEHVKCIEESEEPITMTTANLDCDTIDVIGVFALVYTLYCATMEDIEVSNEWQHTGHRSKQLSLYKKKTTTNVNVDSCCIWAACVEERMQLNSMSESDCHTSLEAMVLMGDLEPCDYISKHFVNVTHLFENSFAALVGNGLFNNECCDVKRTKDGSMLNIYVRRTFTSMYGGKLLALDACRWDVPSMDERHRYFGEHTQRSIFKLDGMLYMLFDWALDVIPGRFLVDRPVLNANMYTSPLADRLPCSHMGRMSTYTRASDAYHIAKSYEYCVKSAMSQTLKETIEMICQCGIQSESASATARVALEHLRSLVNLKGCKECVYFDTPFVDKRDIHVRKHGVAHLRDSAPIFGGDDVNMLTPVDNSDSNVDIGDNDGDHSMVDDNGRPVCVDEPPSKKIKTTAQSPIITDIQPQQHVNGAVKVGQGITRDEGGSSIKYCDVLNYTRHFKNDGRCCQSFADDIVVVLERSANVVCELDAVDNTLRQRLLNMSGKTIKSYPFIKTLGHGFIHNSCDENYTLAQHVKMAYTMQ